jgi:gag-polypeptide of LTR copia-type
MVKLDKQFRDSSLKKGEDKEVWITQLEDISVRLEEMGKKISEKQFMIHVLNNLPPDYDLQVALLESRIGDEKDPLTVSEIRSELSLRFERLNNHSNDENGEASDEMALYSGHKIVPMKDSRLSNTNNNSSGNGNNSNRDRENLESQDMVFAATSDTEEFDDDIWICDSSVSSHYCV